MTESNRSAADARELVFKAFTIGRDIPDPTTVQGGDDDPFVNLNILEPPYDLEVLSSLVEFSSALRPCVDAYALNIDGFGHRFEPAIDFDAPNLADQVGDIMVLEREIKAEREARATAAPGETVVIPEVEEPTDEEIADRIKEMRVLARREKARLVAFFQAAAGRISFPKLRRQTREDIELTGNGGWEVLRDGAGRIVRFNFVPFHTVRLMPIDETPVDVEEHIRITAVSYETVKVRKRMRRFIQVSGIGETRVYLREFGDPRWISRSTGEVFPDEPTMTKAGHRRANEFIHFRIHSARTPYGIPRWIGTAINIRGGRAAEEVNFLYFDNKSIPPMALLVSGGKLDPDSIPRIEKYVEENLKGRKNFHKILVIEVASKDSRGTDGKKPSLELAPLTNAQLKDALFQEYDQRVIDKTGMAFRLPAILRGESKEFNRATADHALRFAEDQVFAPERDDFDFLLNASVLPEMGIRFWRFRSLTPVTRDPERLAKMIAELSRVGVLVPAEGRRLAEDVFNTELSRIDEDWAKRPITFTLAGIQTGVEDLDGDAPSGLIGDARKLLRLREQLIAEEGRLAEKRMRMIRDHIAGRDGDRVNLDVPAEEFDAWFAEDAG